MSLNTATVRLVTSSNIKASVSSSGSVIQSSAPVTLKSGQINRLDSLADVVESNPTDGATLVYRSSDDKYVVQKLDLDGGAF